MKDRKQCELCSFPARMFCESDQARLCWDCDEKVHGANFLVARHSRSLLCHACQSPTPWKASGTRLALTVSVCEACVFRCDGDRHRNSAEDRESEGDNTDAGDDDEDDDDDVEEEEEEEEEGEEEEEDGENQVVPWSSVASLPSPPVASSSSSEEGEASSKLSSRGHGGVSALKRMRQNADLDLDSDDDTGCCSWQQNRKASRTSCDEEDTSLSSLRPWNEGQPTETSRSPKLGDRGETESASAAIIDSVKRFQKGMITVDEAPAMILGICKLSKDPRAAADLRPTVNPTIPARLR